MWHHISVVQRMLFWVQMLRKRHCALLNYLQLWKLTAIYKMGWTRSLCACYFVSNRTITCVWIIYVCSSLSSLWPWGLLCGLPLQLQLAFVLSRWFANLLAEATQLYFTVLFGYKDWTRPVSPGYRLCCFFPYVSSLCALIYFMNYEEVQCLNAKHCQ